MKAAPLANLVAYSAQVACLAPVAALLPLLLRVDAPACGYMLLARAARALPAAAVDREPTSRRTNGRRHIATAPGRSSRRPGPPRSWPIVRIDWAASRRSCWLPASPRG